MSRRAPYVGALRHEVEQRLWENTRAARWLLERDLRVVDRFRRSGSPSVFAAVETSTTSQNGEDGILRHIFAELGVETGHLVEIGAADGEENSTRALVDGGWSGVWLEGDPDKAEHARGLVDPARVTVLDAFVDRDNAVELLSRAGVPVHLDLLSVDVDGNDWWILDRLLGHFRPTVVVTEYNGSHRFPWVMPYDPGHRWDHSWRHGASLESFSTLLGAHGFDLVGCDSRGVNAFFVHRSVRPRSLPATSPKDHPVPPTHRAGTLGHSRRSPLGSGPTPPLDAPTLDAIELRSASVVGVSTVEPGGRIQLIVEIANTTSVELTSADPDPITMSYRVMDGDARPVDLGEPSRALLSSSIAAGASRPSAVEVTVPEVPGRYLVVPTLVQEHVAWRSPVLGEGVYVDVR
ncbi:hypothetical protein BH10ACT1_BH10ACT1_41710 [soil metagenome]